MRPLARLSLFALLCVAAACLASLLAACTGPLLEYENANGPRGQEAFRIGGIAQPKAPCAPCAPCDECPGGSCAIPKAP